MSTFVEMNAGHLAPEAARLLTASHQVRFSFIERDKTIETPTFQRAQGRLEEVYAHPRIGRPPNVLIHGPSGIGKSHIIDGFVGRHPPRRHRATSELRVPIVQMEYPPFPSGRWFAQELAVQLGYCVTLPREASSVFSLLLRRLDQVGARVIVCEEIGNLTKWRNRDVLEFYGMTRWLSNQSKIPLVYTGIETALDLIEGDVQIHRRFERIALEPWLPGAEFAGFIKAYLRYLPLKLPSEVDRAFVNALHEASGGITDTAIKILNRAAKRAILSEAERLVAADLQRDAELPPVTSGGKPIVKRRRRRLL